MYLFWGKNSEVIFCVLSKTEAGEMGGTGYIFTQVTEKLGWAWLDPEAPAVSSGLNHCTSLSCAFSVVFILTGSVLGRGGGSM